MGIDIRLPPINGTDKEMRNYIFQLAQQLQWALSNVDTSSNTVVVAPTPKASSGARVVNNSPQATFESIKDLIIKSADIVTAYYEEINKRLVGEYVAQSDFGVFEEQTSQDIFENSTSVTRAFSNIQEVRTGMRSSLDSLSDEIGQVDSKVADAKATLSGDIADLQKQYATLNYSLVEVTANLKSGLLYTNEDGVPVYGLEVGQKNIIDGVEVFNKFARFTSARLSFYDSNGVEVAYISDYKLYIFNVEITGIYKIGGLVDTVMPNGDVVEKWVGRG